ncbi:MAG: helix-turn-helix transcriptional regulator [Clostridia bacterium]|nr:helix-turn-helix transcriptional regulator [Clostridia bacterium]
MSLQFKINVLEALKEKGYTTYTLRKEQLLSESTIQKLRNGKGISWENIEVLCRLLDCQPSDLMEYVKED